MKIGTFSRTASLRVCALILALAGSVIAQSGNPCAEISNDVRTAVEKDPAKVLMVVEDALVINEACAGEIVKAAIIASKADNTLASQIVQTATTVSPKMTVAINAAAASVSPGVAAMTAAPAPVAEIPSSEPTYNSGKNPVNVYSEKNPVNVYSSKNPKQQIRDAAPDESPDFYIPSTIRGPFLIMPPSSGPIRPFVPVPVSPAVALPVAP
ncbi:MAG: hypothetical protein IPK32_25155 [Verrucomicrobiaceae bacterium]|nr:hypothetical protein [Verrucomicrobiaceae bacterium]